ncbi:hypothetical protein BDZ45DRAFT_736174 [Acephala macrosclerotiorum]|nr:hypothetical protein BDZ45DRAFT_736174 [Acephala macrosclerotiorum]
MSDWSVISSEGKVETKSETLRMGLGSQATVSEWLSGKSAADLKVKSASVKKAALTLTSFTESNIIRAEVTVIVSHKLLHTPKLDTGIFSLLEHPSTCAPKQSLARTLDTYGFLGLILIALLFFVWMNRAGNGKWPYSSLRKMLDADAGKKGYIIVVQGNLAKN